MAKKKRGSALSRLGRGIVKAGKKALSKLTRKKKDKPSSVVKTTSKRKKERKGKSKSDAVGQSKGAASNADAINRGAGREPTARSSQDRAKKQRQLDRRRRKKRLDTALGRQKNNRSGRR